MKSSPFSRSKSMFSAIALALSSGQAMAPFLANLGDYKSRGKGGKHRAQCAKPQYIPNAGRYSPHQGKQECARSVARMATA